MSLRYILGRSGSGKTELCIREITGAAGIQGQPLIYIVPEQFSLQAEKNLIEGCGGRAIMRIQILSFQRLAFRLFSELGGYGKNILDSNGKHMLLRKILYDLRKKLVFFGRSTEREGFTVRLAHTISEFYEYGVTPEQLAAQRLTRPDQDGLSAKLTDLLEIYKLYQAYIADHYISTEETLDLLEGKISSSQYMEGAELWLDGFSGFTPQEYKVLVQLLQKARRVTAVLTLDEAETSFSSLYETDPFFEMKTTVNRLTHLARSNGISVEEPVFLTGNPRFRHAPMLEHLEKNFFLGDAKSYVLKTNEPTAPTQIMLCSSANRYEEIQDAAAEIIDFVRDRGWRYGEIGVAAGALADYAKGIESQFARYRIPFFIDLKTDILSHPLTECIRSAIDVALRNWSYESVFRFLKTGLPPIHQEDVDRLENYVLAYGIKWGRWNKPFTLGFGVNGYKDFEEVEMNGLREQVLLSLLPFTEGLRSDKKLSVQEFSERVFQLVYRNGILERLAEDEEERVKQSGQVWKKICEIFDKLVEILGDEVMSLKEFAQVVEAGLTGADLGVIPPTLDQVLVGDLERSRFPKLKALFILGANEGILPNLREEEGLFTDDERMSLTAAGLELKPDLRRRALQEDFMIYSGVTKPEDFLYLSYSRGGLDGKALQPSSLIARLKNLFPTVMVREKQNEPRISQASVVFGEIGVLMRDRAERSRTWSDEETGLLNTLYNWYHESPWYRDKLSRMERLLEGKDPKEKLAPQQVKKMYGSQILTGVSRLERYVQCPYSYFVRYNLEAKERKEYQVQAVDLGNLFHNVLEEVSALAGARGIGWRQLTGEDIEDLVERAVSKLAPELNGQVFLSTERYKYVMRRVARIAKRSVWALAEHIRRGTFEPLAAELEFKEGSPLTGISVNINNKQKFILTGRIDRIDVMDSNGNLYVKIIDYKSGNMKFDIRDIYFGMQLQLLLYLDAFIKNGASLFDGRLKGELLPGGVFYFNIDDPLIPYPGEIDETQLNEKILLAFKMSGLTLADEAVVKGMDANIRGQSDIIPVYLKTDGSFGAGSNLADLAEYSQLRESVLDKIALIGHEITEGHIPVFPYQKGSRTGCDYCEYRGICQFDAIEAANKYNMVTP